MTDPNATPRPRLSTLGAIYVTHHAAQDYLREGVPRPAGLEEARRTLTALLLDAYVQGDGELREGEQTTVRRRDKRTGLDLSARVTLSGRLIVVVGCTARDLVEGRGNTAARRERRAREGGQ